MIIKNVTVIDGTGKAPQVGVDVLINGGQFADIRPTGTDFSTTSGGVDGEPVLDGRGGYLLPGLWESHTHLSGLDKTGTEAEWAAYQRTMLAGYVRTGITSVCDLGGPLAETRRLRREATGATGAAGAAGAGDAEPSLFFAGPAITGIDGWPLQEPRGGFETTESADDDVDITSVLALQADSVETGLRHVRRLLDEVDYVKCIYETRPGHGRQLPQAALEAIVAAAHDAGKKVLVHISTGADMREAALAGADCIEHALIPRDPSDLSEAEQLAELLARTGTLYCPTIITWEQLARGADRAYLDELIADGIVAPEDVAEITARPTYGMSIPHHPLEDSKIGFDYAMRTLCLFHEAGVKLVAGSDFAQTMPTPAHALLRELQLFAKAGIPCADVISAATAHAAAKVGRQDTVGTIATGSTADAILLDADPLADITHLTDARHRRAVVKSGRVVRH